MSQADHEYIGIGCPPEHSISHPVQQGEAVVSPAAHEAINVGGVTGKGVGAGELNPLDGSEVLFKMYLEMAGKEDKEMAERWGADAKGIILFTGLFSAALAALLSVSIQDLRPNSTDISASYLANIFQLLADRDGSPVSIPSTLSPPSSNFSVPKQAVWVNSLWFLSLVISITCALLATFVQQWAHRYIKVTASGEPYSLHKQARIRAFFAEGLDKSRLPLVVELIPTFLHLSVFLFFAGLCVFLFNLNTTVFSAVVSCVGTCLLINLCIIIMPILRDDTPYNTPLSSLAWYLWTGMLHILFLTLYSFSLRGFLKHWFIRIPFFSYTSVERLDQLQQHYRKRFLGGILKASEESALSLPPEIDGRALVWTIRSLDGDDKQERFFANTLAFCDAFQEADRAKMSEALVRFLHHTLSSNLDSTSKQRRIDICRSAMDAASLSITWPIFERVIYGDWDGLLSSVEFGHFLGAANYSGPYVDLTSKCVVAAIIATAQEHDDRWFELAANQLGKSRDDLENYLTHGDSVLLANCIDYCRRNIQGYSENGHWFIRPVTRSRNFEIVSDFDPSNTLPRLQHEFCDLWNEVIGMTRDSADRRIRSLGIYMLRHIRKIYVALHQGVAAPTAFDASTENYANVLFFPSSYPRCNIPGHGLHTHEATIGPTGENARATVRSVVVRGTTQGISDLPATSLTANSDTLSTTAASTSIPLHVFASQSTGTVAPFGTPDTSSSFPTTTVPSHTPPAGLDPISPSPPCQFDQPPLPIPIPTPTPTPTAISLVSLQANPNATNTDIPIPMDAPYYPYQTARPGPDIAANAFPGATTSPHDVDHPQ